MCQLEMGEDIQRQENTIYVSIGNRDKWHPLHKFSFVSIFTSSKQLKKNIRYKYEKSV